jgi:hypothetical protein
LHGQFRSISCGLDCLRQTVAFGKGQNRPFGNACVSSKLSQANAGRVGNFDLFSNFGGDPVSSHGVILALRASLGKHHGCVGMFPRSNSAGSTSSAVSVALGVILGAALTFGMQLHANHVQERRLAQQTPRKHWNQS